MPKHVSSSFIFSEGKMVAAYNKGKVGKPANCNCPRLR